MQNTKQHDQGQVTKLNLDLSLIFKGLGQLMNKKQNLHLVTTED